MFLSNFHLLNAIPKTSDLFPTPERDTRLSKKLNSLAEGQLLWALRMVRRLAANVHIRFERVILRQIPFLLDSRLSSREHIHMLQVSTETLQLERNPKLDLSHARGMLGPLGEHVRGRFVGFAGFFDRALFLPEGDL